MYISQIYNYLNHDLVPKRRTRTHKASELKEVYNSISKYNQSSPLYLVDLSESRQTQMIDIKEQALTLRDVTEQLSDPDSDLYSKKQVTSDNPGAVTGSFRAHASGELPDQLTLQVEQLASEQVNVGTYLPSDEVAVSAGTYSFYMDTERGKLPFTVTVTDADTNSSIQQQLAVNINGRRLGIQASVVQEGDTSALMLASSDTGVPDTASSLYFLFGSDKSDVFLETFGLNQIQTQPENARFYINDIIHSSASNHISINQAAEFDFLQTTDTPVTIDFSPDKGILTEQLQGFTDAYNHLVSLSETEQPVGIGSRSLYQDIAGIADKHQEQLASIGITVRDDHTLRLDREQAQSVSYDTLKELFGSDSSLRSDILKSVNRLSLDPLAYVDRLIVTYPNADKKQTATYTQSVYSGLMYNNYA